MIKIKNGPDYSKNNEQYNNTVDNVVSTIFLNETQEGYLPLENNLDDYIDFDNATISSNTKRLNSSIVSDSYESLLIESLTRVECEKIILAGVMGAGKTTLITHVIKRLLNHGYTQKTGAILNSKGLIY